MLTPDGTYQALLIVQMLHLAHHRLVKRHISYVEVVTGAVLCVQPTAPMPPTPMIVVHLALIITQVIGSLWIRRLSPSWTDGSIKQQEAR